MKVEVARALKAGSGIRGDVITGGIRLEDISR